jgi:hypothetical protein
MPDSADDRFHRLLAQQLEMNPQTWAALEERGVGVQTRLVIEFSFTAPGKRKAQKLIEILGERTNFKAQLLSDGPMFKRHWRVVGHTQPAMASLDMLNDWVTFMVTLGAKNGECRFDGWGVRVPEEQGGNAQGAQLQHGFGAQRRNGHHDRTLLVDDEALE